MTKLQDLLSRQPRWLVISATATALYAAVLTGQGATLRNENARSGIVSFELARTATDASAIMAAWHRDGELATARRQLELDFGFPPLYSTTLAFLLLLLSARVRSSSAWLARIGSWLAGGQWVAGLADWLENLALLSQLEAGASGSLALAAFLFAALKFALLVSAAAYLVAIAAHRQHTFPLLQYLFYCRFELLLGALVLLLAPIALGPAASLIRNLFSIDPRQALWIGLLASLCAQTVLLALRVKLDYAHVRMRGEPRRPDRLIAWLDTHRVVQVGYLVLPIWLTLVGLSLANGGANRALWTALWFAAGLVISVMLSQIAGALQDVFLPATADSYRVASWRPPPLAKIAVTRQQRARAEPALVGRLASWLGRQFDRLGPGYTVEDPRLGRRRLRAGQALSIAMMTVVLAAYLIGAPLLRPDRHGPSFPSLGFLLIVVLGFAWILPGASFLLDRFRIPVLPALVAYTLLSISLPGWQSDHAFETAPGTQRTAPTLAEVFAAAESVSPREGRPLVVVAASGGGIRASAWTARVLTALEGADGDGIGPDFEQAVRLISGVSGGSAGTMFYLAGKRAKRSSSEILEQASATSLYGSAWGLAYPDLWRIVPPPGHGWFATPTRDRGWGLEQAWRRTLGCRSGCPDLSLSRWSREAAGGTLPAFALNATVIETGEPFVFAPFVQPAAWRAASFFGDLPGSDVSVTTAARLSATFPWVSPVARADRDGYERVREWEQQHGVRRSPRFAPEHHLADGGYYDNSGSVIALEWLDSVLADESLRTTGEPIERVALILIGAFPTETKDAEPVRRVRAGLVHGNGWKEAAIGPLQGLLQVRTSSQRNRNRLEIESFRAKWARAERPVEIEQFAFDFFGDAPLSWKLTPTETCRIRCGWNAPENRRALRELRAFFCQGGRCPAAGSWSRPATPKCGCGAVHAE